MTFFRSRSNSIWWATAFLRGGEGKGVNKVYNGHYESGDLSKCRFMLMNGRGGLRRRGWSALKSSDNLMDLEIEKKNKYFDNFLENF